MGGILVDGGTFDWSAPGKFPMLSEPHAEYDGLVLSEAFGNMAFALGARVLSLRDLGPALSPFNAFMIATGIETLPLRMQRHCDNALQVAAWLQQSDKVSWVSYPGLEDDANHALQQRYSPKGAGAVFTFGLKGGYEAGKTFVEGLQLFSHLANIGDTRSLVIHPSSTTHAQLSPNSRWLLAPVRMWCGCQSVLKMPMTLLPISLSRSIRSETSRGHADPVAFSVTGFAYGVPGLPVTVL